VLRSRMSRASRTLPENETSLAPSLPVAAVKSIKVVKLPPGRAGH
jgi:hypothetical protein